METEPKKQTKTKEKMLERNKYELEALNKLNISSNTKTLEATNIAQKTMIQLSPERMLITAACMISDTVETLPTPEAIRELLDIIQNNKDLSLEIRSMANEMTNEIKAVKTQNAILIIQKIASQKIIQTLKQITTNQDMPEVELLQNEKLIADAFLLGDAIVTIKDQAKRKRLVANTLMSKVKGVGNNVAASIDITIQAIEDALKGEYDAKITKMKIQSISLIAMKLLSLSASITKPLLERSPKAAVRELLTVARETTRADVFNYISKILPIEMAPEVYQSALHEMQIISLSQQSKEISEITEGIVDKAERAVLDILSSTQTDTTQEQLSIRTTKKVAVLVRGIIETAMAAAREAKDAGLSSTEMSGVVAGAGVLGAVATVENDIIIDKDHIGEDSISIVAGRVAALAAATSTVGESSAAHCPDVLRDIISRALSAGEDAGGAALRTLDEEGLSQEALIQIGRSSLGIAGVVAALRVGAEKANYALRRQDPSARAIPESLNEIASFIQATAISTE